MIDANYRLSRLLTVNEHVGVESGHMKACPEQLTDSL